MSSAKAIRCALYARQSDPHRKGHQPGDDRSLSIEVQIEHCRRKAAELAAKVEDVYAEQITSEVFKERPQLRRLLARLAPRR
jgi:hypothetical protein